MSAAEIPAAIGGSLGAGAVFSGRDGCARPVFAAALGIGMFGSPRDGDAGHDG
jgi:hypothetical protein